ncbi:NAD-dependent epimerase/dehydratase family protein [Streptomyces cyaneofuscatus]|uniref:NAD-dependent epimerase/dehydratase family protein n=1 Tax=Streptomyces cyaneofuscatus TaxID=66883 RepID=UPI003787987B
MPTVMIAGAAGFAGRHVAAEAARQGAALALMSHRRTPHRPNPNPGPGGPVRSVRADLADPDSLRGVCRGVDVLLHCASLIGGTPGESDTVNARGTAALVAEAQRAGVSRIVYLSTASVYGRGTFSNVLPRDLERRPKSSTSRTRALAEDAVLAAGGFVLRPYLVYGRGDDWVVPGLTRLLRALPGRTSGWNARLSVISVTELAALLVGQGSPRTSACRRPSTTRRCPTRSRHRNCCAPSPPSPGSTRRARRSLRRRPARGCARTGRLPPPWTW